MARRTFMRAFSAQAGMSFGRWRHQARLFAALEMPGQSKSVMEVAIAVGYDSVSAFIEMFWTMLGTTPQTYFRGRYSRAGDRAVAATARLPFFRQTTPRIVVSLVAHRDSDLSVFIFCLRFCTGVLREALEHLRGKHCKVQTCVLEMYSKEMS
jgi:AraC-like DNA-binding protein